MQDSWLIFAIIAGCWVGVEQFSVVVVLVFGTQSKARMQDIGICKLLNCVVTVKEIVSWKIKVSKTSEALVYIFFTYLVHKAQSCINLLAIYG